MPTPVHATSVTRQAVRGAAAELVSRGVLVGAGLATQAVCLGQLGLTEYGRFATANLFGMCGSLLLVSGLPQAVRIAAAADPGADALARWWILRRHLPLALAASAAAVFASPAVAHGLGDPELTRTLQLTAVEVAARAGVFEPWVLLLNATGRQRTQAVAQGGYGLARLAAVVGCLSTGWGLAAAVAAYTATALVGAAVAAAVLAVLGGQGGASRAGFRDRVLCAVRFTVGYDLLPFLLPSTTVWMLKGSGQEPELVGLFSACVLASSPLVTLGAALGVGVFPHLARSLAGGDRGGAGAIVSSATRLMTLVYPAAVAFAAVRGGAVVRLLHDPAAGAGLVPLAAVAGGACLGATLFLVDVITASGAVRFRLWMGLGLTASHLTLGPALLVAFGGGGLPWALPLAAAGGLAVAVVRTRRIVGPFFPAFWTVRAALAGPLAAGALALCPDPRSPAAVALQLSGGLAVTVAALAVFAALGGRPPRFRAAPGRAALEGRHPPRSAGPGYTPGCDEVSPAGRGGP